MCLVGNYRSTVTVYHISGVMASGDSRPKWNPFPESVTGFVERPGVDRDLRFAGGGRVGHVLDVIGLRAHNDGAKPTRVLPGRAQNSVWVLIPDDRAASWGFHNVTLVDMAGATGPSVSKEDLSSLRRQWPVSLVAGMSNRQTDLELMRRDCKARFRAHPTGACTYCGRNIVHAMAHHVSSFHLDLGQLWRCPVSWCTQWNGTPHDCIDHIRKKHNVGDSVKTASLGNGFPPWTVTRAEWYTALKHKVSGISKDTSGYQLVMLNLCVPVI